MLGSGNRHKLSPFSRNMSRWEFKDFPTSKIELLKNNQLKIEHENIEIDSNIVSFGGAKKRPIKELLQQETISFVYKQAFPVSLGNINYDYRSENEIESSFTFSFTQLLVNLL